MTDVRPYLRLAVVVSTLVGCVGTDLVPETADPARDDVGGAPSISVSPSAVGLLVDETVTLQASYHDADGVEVAGIPISWTTSEPSIASVDTNGVVTAVGPGQGMITASAMGVDSAPALVTVVNDVTEVATVTISPTAATLQVGESLQLSAEARTSDGSVVSGAPFTWASSDPSVDVDDNGLLSAIQAGTALIRASADGVVSPATTITVPGTERSGTFVGVGGHSVGGGVALVTKPDGSLVVEMASDFFSQSGPDLEVFVSPTSSITAESVSLGDLTQNSGAHSYATPPGTQLVTYDYVMVHCVPFNITFGRAELQ